MDEKLLNQEIERLEQEIERPLSTYLVKTPTSEDTMNLIHSLQAEFNEISIAENIFPEEEHVWENPSLLRQIKIQAQSYRWYFWLISLIVFAVLVFVTYPAEGKSLVFQQIIPLYILVGAIYHYKTWNLEMRMVESITPFPPALLLYSRLMIILIMNLFLGIVASFYLRLTSSEIEFLPFILSWVTPSVVVTGILIYMMFWKGIKSGFAAAMLVWFAFNSINEAVYLQESMKIFYLMIQILVLVFGILLFYFSYRKGQNMRTVL